MVRIGKGVGFAVGVLMGFITRDSYQYPYPLRVDDLKDDYDRFIEKNQERQLNLKKTVAMMTFKLEEAQGIYIQMKHRQYADDSAPKDFEPEKQSLPKGKSIK